MAVAKEETSAWMCRLGVIAALNAIIFLHYGLMWVAAAGCLARVIGRHFFGLVDCSPMLSAAASLVRCCLAFAVLLCPAVAMLFRSPELWSVSKDSKKGIKDLLTLVVIGGIVLLAFMMLIAAAYFVVGQSPLKGNQSSIWGNLGLFGVFVAQYFISTPMKALKKQCILEKRKAQKQRRMK